MSDEPETSRPRRWRRSDFTRAVIELAQALGWDVAWLADVSRLRSASSGQLARSPSAPSLLVLVNAGRRRLVFVELRSDGAIEEPRRDRAFVDTLRTLTRDAASDKRDRAIAEAGHAVPSMDLVVGGRTISRMD